MAHLRHYGLRPGCRIRVRQDKSIRRITSESASWGHGGNVDIEDRWGGDLLWFDFVPKIYGLVPRCVGKRDVD